jgi:hypothetical protein
MASIYLYEPVRRLPRCSRPVFQIWPHAVQRQYVETLTSLLAVLTSGELQKGHALGATLSSRAGWSYTGSPSESLDEEPTACGRLRKALKNCTPFGERVPTKPSRG